MPRITPPHGHAGLGDGVQAAVLALEVIEHLAGQPEAVGVTAIANTLGSTKSRIHRHLRTLVRLGYLAQADDSEKYRVGERLVRLARRVGEKFDLAAAAQASIRELRDALGHFTVVSQVESEGVRVLASLSASSMMEIGVKRGSLLGFHYSAQGKIVLAFGDPALRERVLAGPLEMQSPRTITSARALQREIDRVRRQGWAVAPGEATLGINALAAPIRDAGGALVGTIAIVDSIQHIPEVPSDEQVRRILEAAARVSAVLGYVAPPGPVVGRRVAPAAFFAAPKLR